MLIANNASDGLPAEFRLELCREIVSGRCDLAVPVDLGVLPVYSLERSRVEGKTMQSDGQDL